MALSAVKFFENHELIKEAKDELFQITGGKEYTLMGEKAEPKAPGM